MQACDTFLKIAQKCRRKFVTCQLQEQNAFVDELLVDNGVMISIGSPAQPPFTLRQVISKLEKHQIHTVYEAIATMISSLSSETELERKEQLVAKLMSIPNDEVRLGTHRFLFLSLSLFFFFFFCLFC
jgi:exportin-1